MLQFVGYYPDKKLHKAQNFKSAFSDILHGTIATNANFFVTHDVNLRRRLAATYEYIGVGPAVCYLDYEKDFQLIIDPETANQ